MPRQPGTRVASIAGGPPACGLPTHFCTGTAHRDRIGFWIPHDRNVTLAALSVTLALQGYRPLGSTPSFYLRLYE